MHNCVCVCAQAAWQLWSGVSDCVLWVHIYLTLWLWCFGFTVKFRTVLSTVSSLLFNPVQFNTRQRITCCNCWLLFKALKMQDIISGLIHDNL